MAQDRENEKPKLDIKYRKKWRIPYTEIGFGENRQHPLPLPLLPPDEPQIKDKKDKAVAKVMNRQEAIGGIQDNRVGIEQLIAHLTTLVSKVDMLREDMRKNLEPDGLNIDDSQSQSLEHEFSSKLSQTVSSKGEYLGQPRDAERAIADFKEKLIKGVSALTNLQKNMDHIADGADVPLKSELDKIHRNLGDVQMLFSYIGERSSKNSFYSSDEIARATRDAKYVDDLKILFKDFGMGDDLSEYAENAAKRKDNLVGYTTQPDGMVVKKDNRATFARRLEEIKEMRTERSHEAELKRNPEYREQVAKEKAEQEAAERAK